MMAVNKAIIKQKWSKSGGMVEIGSTSNQSNTNPQKQQKREKEMLEI